MNMSFLIVLLLAALLAAKMWADSRGYEILEWMSSGRLKTMGLSFETLDKLFFNTVTIINEVMFMKCHKYINECGNT